MVEIIILMLDQPLLRPFGNCSILVCLILHVHMCTCCVHNGGSPLSCGVKFITTTNWLPVDQGDELQEVQVHQDAGKVERVRDPVTECNKFHDLQDNNTTKYINGHTNKPHPWTVAWQLCYKIYPNIPSETFHSCMPVWCTQKSGRNHKKISIWFHTDSWYYKHV